MKKSILLTVISLAMVSSLSFAADSDDDMDSLGGNRDLIKRARSMDPDNQVQVVQNRAVDRDMRFEFGVNYGVVAGGDPYLSTQNLGFNADFHIDPHWSVGARYITSFNSLNSEGNNVYSAAQQAQANGEVYTRPAVDYVRSTELGVIDFYPIYGKMNMFDMGVVQFDVYVLGGAGQINLDTGSTFTYTAGGGVGLWLTQHISSRFEVRYQNYQDQIYSGSRNINDIILSAGIGFLL